MSPQRPQLGGVAAVRGRQGARRASASGYLFKSTNGQEPEEDYLHRYLPPLPPLPRLDRFALRGLFANGPPLTTKPIAIAGGNQDPTRGPPERLRTAHLVVDLSTECRHMWGLIPLRPRCSHLQRGDHGRSDPQRAPPKGADAYAYSGTYIYIYIYV